MRYAVLADLTLVLHAVFIVFVVIGGMLVFWRRRSAWFHIPCALWGALIELKGWICPLTYLENDLRARAGASGYSGGYIDHYLMPMVYPGGLTSEVQTMLGMSVLLVNAVVYGLAWYKTRPGSG